MKYLLVLVLVSVASAAYMKDMEVKFGSNKPSAPTQGTEFAICCAFCRAKYDDELHQHKRQTSPFVAFSAGLNKMQNVTTGVNIMFNDIILNLGNGYNNATGVFTAPVDGTYVFIYHGLSETDGQLYMDLYKNNVYEVTAYAHNIGDYASVSNSVVLQLVKGDQIHLQGRGVNQLYGDPAEVYATFSGFILKPSNGGA